MFLATDEDRDLAKRVIIDEYKDTKQVLTDAMIASKVDEVINVLIKYPPNDGQTQ